MKAVMKLLFQDVEFIVQMWAGIHQLKKKKKNRASQALSRQHKAKHPFDHWLLNRAQVWGSNRYFREALKSNIVTYTFRAPMGCPLRFTLNCESQAPSLYGCPLVLPPQCSQGEQWLLCEHENQLQEAHTWSARIYSGRVLWRTAHENVWGLLCC